MDNKACRKYLNLKEKLKENFLPAAFLVIAAAGLAALAIGAIKHNEAKKEQARMDLWNIPTIEHYVKNGERYSTIASRAPRYIINTLGQDYVEDHIMMDLNHTDKIMLSTGQKIYVPKGTEK
jgi:hypothetical protein